MSMGYHILRVSTGKDFEVVERLVAMGVDAVSVVTRQEHRHRRSKRKLTRIRPLFAGYVFARVPDVMWRGVKGVTGVIGPLRSDGGTGYPDTIDDDTVARLQEASELESLVDPEGAAPFQLGERVTFDLFAQKLEAAVKSVRGNVVEATTEISGKRVTVTRVADQLGAAQAA